MDLDALVKANRIALVPAAEELVKRDEFTLGTPCVLIAEGAVTQVPLSALKHRLRCSVSLASEPIEKFLLLKAEHGFNRAFELCASDDADGQAFVEEWDRSQKDLGEGVVCTLNDICSMVEQAQRGWTEAPRRILVVARHGDKVASGLVPVDWVLGA